MILDFVAGDYHDNQSLLRFILFYFFIKAAYFRFNDTYKRQLIDCELNCIVMFYLNVTYFVTEMSYINKKNDNKSSNFCWFITNQINHLSKFCMQRKKFEFINNTPVNICLFSYVIFFFNIFVAMKFEFKRNFQIDISYHISIQALNLNYDMYKNNYPHVSYFINIINLLIALYL